jgi:cell division protein FtsZ
VLLSIAGGSDLGLFEINEAAQLVADAAHPDANIIFGTVVDDAMGDEVQVTVIAAGFERWDEKGGSGRTSGSGRGLGLSAGDDFDDEDGDDEFDVPSFLK